MNGKVVSASSPPLNILSETPHSPCTGGQKLGDANKEGTRWCISWYSTHPPPALPGSAQLLWGKRQPGSPGRLHMRKAGEEPRLSPRHAHVITLLPSSWAPGEPSEGRTFGQAAHEPTARETQMLSSISLACMMSHTDQTYPCIVSILFLRTQRWKQEEANQQNNEPKMQTSWSTVGPASGVHQNWAAHTGLGGKRAGSSIRVWDRLRCWLCCEQSILQQRAENAVSTRHARSADASTLGSSMPNSWWGNKQIGGEGLCV